jgi:predicted aminopeptidase
MIGVNNIVDDCFNKKIQVVYSITRRIQQYMRDNTVLTTMHQQACFIDSCRQLFQQHGNNYCSFINIIDRTMLINNVISTTHVVLTGKKYCFHVGKCRTLDVRDQFLRV